MLQRGLFQPAEVARLIKENATGQQDHTLRLWALLSLEVWQQVFLDEPALTGPAIASGGEIGRA
jgi:hypothetical protein